MAKSTTPRPIDIAMASYEAARKKDPFSEETKRLRAAINKMASSTRGYRLTDQNTNEKEPKEPAS